MKKTYITPAVTLTLLAGTQMIAASGDLILDGQNYTGELGQSNATGAGLSKSYNVWDDDWSAAE